MNIFDFIQLSHPGVRAWAKNLIEKREEDSERKQQLLLAVDHPDRFQRDPDLRRVFNSLVSAGLNATRMTSIPTDWEIAPEGGPQTFSQHSIDDASFTPMMAERLLSLAEQFGEGQLAVLIDLSQQTFLAGVDYIVPHADIFAEYARNLEEIPTFLSAAIFLRREKQLLRFSALRRSSFPPGREITGEAWERFAKRLAGSGSVHPFGLALELTEETLRIDMGRTEREPEVPFTSNDLRAVVSEPASRRGLDEALFHETTVKLPKGLHLRPSVQLIQIAERYNDGTRLTIQTAVGDQVEIMGVLSVTDLLELGIVYDDRVLLIARGPSATNRRKIIHEVDAVLSVRGDDVPPPLGSPEGESESSIPPSTTSFDFARSNLLAPSAASSQPFSRGAFSPVRAMVPGAGMSLGMPLPLPLVSTSLFPR